MLSGHPDYEPLSTMSHCHTMQHLSLRQNGYRFETLNSTIHGLENTSQKVVL